MDRGLNNSVLRGESSDCKVCPMSIPVTTDDNKRMCQASSEDKKHLESQSTNCYDEYQNSYMDYQKQENDTSSDSENSKSALLADKPGRKFLTAKLRPNRKPNRMPGDQRTRLNCETVQLSSKQRADLETPSKIMVTQSVPRPVSPAKYHSAKSVSRQSLVEQRRFSGDRRQRSRSNDDTVSMTHRSTRKDFQEKHYIADDRLRVENRKFRSDIHEFNRRIAADAEKLLSSATHNFTRRRSESRKQMCTNVVAYEVNQISNEIEALNQQHCPPNNVIHRTCVKSGNTDRQWAHGFKRTRSLRGRIVSLNPTSCWKPNRKYGVHRHSSAWDHLDCMNEFVADDVRMRQSTEYSEGDRPDYRLKGPSPVVHQFEDRLSSPWNGDCDVQPRRPVRSRLGWRKPSYHPDLPDLPYQSYSSAFKRGSNRGLISNSWNQLNESRLSGRERRLRRFPHLGPSHADAADQLALDKEQLKSRTSEIFSGISVNRYQIVKGVGRRCSRPSKSDWEDIVSESLSNLRRTAENRGTVSDLKHDNNRSCHQEVRSSNNNYDRKMCGSGFVDEYCDLDRFRSDRRSGGRVHSRWSLSPSTSRKHVASAQSNSDSKRDSKADRLNLPSFEQDRKVKSGSLNDNNADHDVILLSYSDDDCSVVGHISSKSRTSVRLPVGFKKTDSAAARELATEADEVESNKMKQSGPHTPVIDEICSPVDDVSDCKLDKSAVNTNDLTLNITIGTRSSPVETVVLNSGGVTNGHPHHAVAATAPAWPTYPPHIEPTSATLAQPEAALWISSQLKTGSSQSVYKTNWPTVADQQLPQFVNGSASAIYSATSLVVEAPKRNAFNDVPANPAALSTRFAGTVAVPQYGFNPVADGFGHTGSYSTSTSQNSASMFAPPVELDVYGDSPLLDEPVYQLTYATTVDGSSVTLIDSGSLASVCQSLPISTADVVQPPVFSVVPNKQALSTTDVSHKVVQKDQLLPNDRLERIADEVKAALRPYFVSGQIDKEEYKDIMRRAVPKINASKTAGIDPKRIKYFVTEYVSKVKMAQKRVVADKLHVSGVAM